MFLVGSLVSLNLIGWKCSQGHSWAKYGGDHTLPMVQWDVSIFPKESGLGLIDVAAQGKILKIKRIMRCLKGPECEQDLG